MGIKEFFEKLSRRDKPNGDGIYDTFTDIDGKVHQICYDRRFTTSSKCFLIISHRQNDANVKLLKETENYHENMAREARKQLDEYNETCNHSPRIKDEYGNENIDFPDNRVKDFPFLLKTENVPNELFVAQVDEQRVKNKLIELSKDSSYRLQFINTWAIVYYLFKNRDWLKDGLDSPFFIDWVNKNIPLTKQLKKSSFQPRTKKGIDMNAPDYHSWRNAKYVAIAEKIDNVFWGLWNRTKMKYVNEEMYMKDNPGIGKMMINHHRN